MRAPRWLCLLTALLTLGVGSGCPGEPIPCINSAPAQRTSVPVFGVGTEASFSVSADLSRACEEPNAPRQPETVTVEVKDPDNLPVPATATLNAGGGSATLRFKPATQGRHHVIVAFAPVGSLHQFGVFAGEDRRQETTLASIPTREGCTSVGRTARGTWLCGAEARRESAATPQALSPSLSSHTVVAGDVVWTVAGDRVHRYVDTGTGPLELTGTAPYPAGAGPGSTSYRSPLSQLATPEELVVLSDLLLHRYTFTEADGLTTAPTMAWIPQGALYFGGDSVNGLLVRAGARRLLVTRVNDSRAPEARTQACPLQPGEGGAYQPVTGEACQTLVGEPVGYEEGVVWTRTFDTTTGLPETLRRYTGASGRLLEEGALAMSGQLATNPAPLRPGPSVPIMVNLGTNEPLVAPRWNAARGLLELELLPDPPGVTMTYLGEHFLWMNDPSGLVSTQVYARQSTR